MHRTPFQNFVNIYEPAHGALTGALAVNNFANPINFLCGAIQAASRLNAEQSAKLCVQYLAPIVKNRQYNFLPIRVQRRSSGRKRDPTKSPTARTGCGRLSEPGDRDCYEGPLPATLPPPETPLPTRRYPPRPLSTDPAAGLPGMMVPHGGRVVTRILASCAPHWRCSPCSLAIGAVRLRVARPELVCRCPAPQGGGPGSYTIQAQLPDVNNIEPNSRVRVGDVTVGNVTKIERQGWHALLTMRLNGDVDLPANATAKIGQTSLLGSLHIELAPPTGVRAGRASCTTVR